MSEPDGRDVVVKMLYSEGGVKICGLRCGLMGKQEGGEDC